jgi:uncharacterized phiE125 gp8 family phage protein
LKSKVTTQPTTEPVSLEEVKASLRITDTNEDALITQYIKDARVYAENFTGRKFITQTLTGYVNNFYSKKDSWFNGFRIGSEVEVFGQGGRYLQLDWGPCQSISQVDTIDIDNTETVYASSNYYLDNYDDDINPRVVINDNTTIVNTSLRSHDAVKVTFIAGYGSNASDVPAALRRAIILMASYLYEHRGSCDGQCAEKSGANSYLEQYKIESVSV